MSWSVKPVAYVSAGRKTQEDDFWGGECAVLTLSDEIEPEALSGLSEFSHVEVIYVFHGVPEEKIITGARHPRNNAAWPRVGIFAQRAKARPNRIGSTICEVVEVSGRCLTVRELDAIDGTPVLDIKPVMKEFLPRGATRQPRWSTELMAEYWSSKRGGSFVA